MSCGGGGTTNLTDSTVSYALQHTRLWSNTTTDRITSVVHNVLNNTYKNDVLREMMTWVNDNSRVLTVPKLKSVLLWGLELWTLVQSYAHNHLMTLINTLNICVQDRSNMLKDRYVFYTGRYVVKTIELCYNFTNQIARGDILTETMKNLNTVVKILPESMKQLAYNDEKLDVTDILWQALSTVASTEFDSRESTSQKAEVKKSTQHTAVQPEVILEHFIMPGFGYVITVHKSKWIKCIPLQVFVPKEAIDAYINKPETTSAQKLFWNCVNRKLISIRQFSVSRVCFGT